MKPRNLFMVTLALLAIASPSWASPLFFSYNGGAGSFSFQLDTMPSPFASTDDLAFQVLPTGLENGQSSDFGGGIYFFNLGFGGGFQTLDGSFATNGPQIYSGSEDAPIFGPGAFTLLGDDGETPDGVLTISSTAVSAAPEPASWLLMIAGVGMIGAFLSSRRRREARRASSSSRVSGV